MDREVNADSIRALEEQIEEGKGDTIKLKRARNSLLNISTRIPPEVLGAIFTWCLARGTDRSLYYPCHFEGLQKGSHNFLLVCHHWFKVASRTPELWGFWGNTLQQWRKYHHRWAGIAPLDLVLDGGQCDPHALFDGSLQDAVRIGVMRDTIRQVHLASDEDAALSSIILSLTPNDKTARNENMESIVWRKGGSSPVDVSDFFARSRLSKLRFLELSGNLRISSWNRMASQTTLLTTLSLKIFDSRVRPVQTPTTSQLLSILSSNPNLRELRLTDGALPKDPDGFAFQIPLHHLRVLSLSGEFYRLCGLLHQLILPETLDKLHLTGSNPTTEGISQQLGPYMGDYFRRGTGFQDGLEISSYYATHFVSVSVGAVPAQTPVSASQVTLTMALGDPPQGLLKQLFVDLIALVPREPVVSFIADGRMKLPEELYLTMPNIESLRLFNVELSDRFLQPDPRGPCAHMKFFPSLRSLCLEDIDLDDNDWGHLIAYLTHQTSGGQIISLELFADFPCLTPEMVDEVEGLVGNFNYHPDMSII